MAPLRRGQPARRRVPGAGRRHHDPLGAGGYRGVEQLTVRPDPGRQQVDATTPLPGNDLATRSARPLQHDPPVHDPAQCPAVWRPERRERRRVQLGHVVGGLQRPGQGHHDTGVPQLRRHRRGDRIAQVRGAIESILVRGPHRAGHDDRLRRAQDEVPREARLLDRVGALDDDHAVDRGVIERVLDDATDAEHVLEREVAGRRQPAIDRHDLGDRLEARRPGQDRRPVERRDVAARHRIEAHADRPAREHDRDAGHARQPCSVSVGSAAAGGGSSLVSTVSS